MLSAIATLILLSMPSPAPGISIIAASAFAASLSVERTMDLPSGLEEVHCDSSSCTAWFEVRKEFPFPHQDVVAINLDDSETLFILLEPPPELNQRDIDRVLKSHFGTAMRRTHRERWPIGIGGWLEDTLVEVNLPCPDCTEEERDYLRRSHTAALRSALIGTRVAGGSRDRLHSKRSDELDIRLSPRDLDQWLYDGDASWTELNDSSRPPRSWNKVAEEQESGVFVNSLGTLVVLALPKPTFIGQDPDLDEFRAPFHDFAAASDVILGGRWSRESKVAYLIARARQVPIELLPPLRIESVRALFAETEDGLSQSYERNIPLAGRIIGGDLDGKDWAPILLSKSLVDTEFGALLNITDQILKSWSQRGQIEYQYFEYRLKPPYFPFGAQTAMEALGVDTLQYNWNTEGAAIEVVDGLDYGITIARTGALPLTYGTSLNDSPVDRHRVLKQEDIAFDYFSALGDPNVARVVQYSVIYQLSNSLRRYIAPSSVQRQDTALPEEALTSMARNLKRTIDSLLSGEHIEVNWTDFEDAIAFEELADVVDELYALSPNTSLDALTSFLIEPNTEQVVAEYAGSNHSAKAERAVALKRRISFWLGQIAAFGADRRMAQEDYVKSAARIGPGSIRTPAIVISWCKCEGLVGGHNIGSTPLRLERTAEKESTLTEDGVFRVADADFENALGNADAIARAVARRDDSIDIETLLNQSPRGRSGRVALQVGTREARKLVSEIADSEPLVHSVQETLAKDGQLVIHREPDGALVFTEKSTRVPPAYRAVRADDLSSAVDVLSRRTKTPPARKLVFVGVPIRTVRGLMEASEAAPQSREIRQKVSRLLSAKGISRFGDPESVVFESKRGNGLIELLRLATRKAKDIVDLALGTRVSREEWSFAEPRLLSAADAADLLSRSGWNQGLDGVPIVVEIPLRTEGMITVAAGFGKPPARRQAVDAFLMARQKVPAEGATPAELADAAIAELRAASGSDVRRALIAISEGKGEQKVAAYSQHVGVPFLNAQ